MRANDDIIVSLQPDTKTDMKNFSSKLLLSFVFVVFVLSSCKKDSSPPEESPEYYVKFKLDGADQQYSEIAAADFSGIDPVHDCSIFGEKKYSSGVGYEGIIVRITDDKEIVANVTYTEAVVASIDMPQGSLYYSDPAGYAFLSGFASSPNVRITITHMDATTVTGTFSGTIVSAPDRLTTHTVTNGQFHVLRQ